MFSLPNDFLVFKRKSLRTDGILRSLTPNLTVASQISWLIGFENGLRIDVATFTISKRGAISDRFSGLNSTYFTKKYGETIVNIGRRHNTQNDGTTQDIYISRDFTYHHIRIWTQNQINSSTSKFLNSILLEGNPLITQKKRPASALTPAPILVTDLETSPELKRAMKKKRQSVKEIPVEYASLTSRTPLENVEYSRPPLTPYYHGMVAKNESGKIIVRLRILIRWSNRKNYHLFRW